MKISPMATRLCSLAMLSSTLLAGCVSQPKPLYYWGDYQSQVYGHFKGEKGPEEQIQALELAREQAKSKGQQLPPGFQAHLAMLYGQTGRSERLVENLEAEKQQFPESATFMDFLLKKFTP
jgi:hypothetical protein